MRLRWMLPCIAAALLACAPPVRAQTAAGPTLVTGTVVAHDSITPVPSVIVVAVDDAGKAVARALTSRAGFFTLRITAAGRYRLDVLRIGYQPTRGPTVTVGAGSIDRVRIVFAGQAVSLAAMTVNERETCRVSADTGLAVAQVWEEARKAMLTTQLSGDNAPLFAEWIEYDRMLDSTSRLVRQQHVRTSRNPTTHAFRSVPADVLQDKGYVVPDSVGTNYYVPDADVLLSDAFVAGHCFHLVAAPPGRPATIGVAFVPTRDRRDMKEIQGTLWVDRATAELRTLEFSYINMPESAEPAHSGGTVDFLRLDDGNWLVSRWTVRMPRLGLKGRTSDDGMRRTIMSSSNSTLRAVQVAGGEVNRVTRRDSLVFQATGPAMSVQVLPSDSGMSAAGAVIALGGTDYTGVADARGLVRLSPVLGGRYSVMVHTAFMDTLGMPPVMRELDTHMDARVDTVMLPRAKDVLAAACPKEALESFEGMVHGMVRDAGARPMKQAAVTASWKTNFSLVGTTDGDNLSHGEKTIGVLSDDSGYWRLCGVPPGVPISVAVVTDSGSDVQGIRLSDRAYGFVDLVAHPASAAQREVSRAVNPVARPRALVELVVTDTRGAAIAGAALEVQRPDSPVRSMLTGPSGRALVPDVAPGRLIVRARHLGFTPGEVSITVETGRNTVPIMMSAVGAPMLDTMRVVGGRVGRSRLDEFETRRLNHEASASFSREEIEKRHAVDLWQVLMGVAGITIAVRDYEVVATSRRAVIKEMLNPAPCFLRVVIDGVLMNAEGSFNLRDLPRPDEVYGVEVFSGPARIPQVYGGIGSDKWCGLIAVWTR